MLDRLNQLASISVARGVGFAGLAILCGMLGFYGNPHAFLKFGGVSTLLVTAVLLLKARHAPSLGYRRTELWLMLEPHERPPETCAQQVISTARQGALLRFAHSSAAISALFLASATCVQFVRLA